MGHLRGTAELAALIPLVADASGIAEAYVEKDFWATESLRALTVYADEAGAPAIFKGGTSLSKAWRLTQRFSEDIDIILDFPDEMAGGQRERILKGIPAAVDVHLGLGDAAYRSAHQKKNVARSVFVAYPIAHPSDSTEVKPEVLLEVGSRGAPTPNSDVEVLSFVAEYLLEQGSPDDEYEELKPVRAHVLAPERTLVEKVALLANRDARFQRGELDAFAGLGRHLYDVNALLSDQNVQERLTVMGADGVRVVALDVHERSLAANWSSVAQPDGGWIATMECFVAESTSSQALAEAYKNAASMIYGDAPTFDECVDTIRQYSEVI